MDIRKGTQSFNSIINFTPELWQVISDYVNTDYDRYDITIDTNDGQVIDCFDADRAFEAISLYRDDIDVIKIRAFKGNTSFVDIRFDNNGSINNASLIIDAAVEKEMAKRLNEFGNRVQDLSGAKERTSYYSSLLYMIASIMFARNMADIYFPADINWQLLANIVIISILYALSRIMRRFVFPKIIKREERETRIGFWRDGKSKRKVPMQYYRKIAIIENIAGLALLVVSFIIVML